MKKWLILILIMISVLAQASQVTFINELLTKEEANFYDCVKSFCYLTGIEVSNEYNKDVSSLQSVIPVMPKNSTEDDILTIGDFSLLALQYLKEEGGLFYKASKSGRYASRELSFIGILPDNTSEFEKISGEMLMRLLRRVDEYEK